MKRLEVTPDELSKENPQLFKKIEGGFHLVLPQIKQQVAATLVNQKPGMVAVHATFLRLQEDKENGETLFVEMQIYFVRLPQFGKINARLAKIIFYDTFQEYEQARLKVSGISETKFGRGFPNMTKTNNNESLR